MIREVLTGIAGLVQPFLQLDLLHSIKVAKSRYFLAQPPSSPEKNRGAILLSPDPHFRHVRPHALLS
jgi:hypothetical protein